ncbi:hypothetical protein [Streptomyces sp. NPDC006997]|uniref:hypothetical protein n=1 Tax=Streptomyces sp. NPDC006997 TaxID=3155356 RepID=UPI0033F97435
MEHRRDEKAILASIEERLAWEDPALAARLDLLSRQVAAAAEPYGPPAHAPADGAVEREGSTDPGPEEAVDFRWSLKVAVVLTLVAVAGLLLASVILTPDSGERQPPRSLASVSRSSVGAGEKATGDGAVPERMAAPVIRLPGAS